MRYFSNTSIKSILTSLAILSILPAFTILFYTGMERRQQTIDTVAEQVSSTVRGMAEQQREITRSAKSVLTILSRLPDIKNLNIKKTNEIFRSFVDKNPNYTNLALVSLDGHVIASAHPYNSVNLSDRKHFKDALTRKGFAVGEFIISRIGPNEPKFPYAITILGNDGEPVGVLTTVIKLTTFNHYLDASTVPEGSFVAITDHNGVRLYYHPEKTETNPIGKPIRGKNWEIAQKAKTSGRFLSEGSDGRNRIFAYQAVRLNPDAEPYAYVWSGIPEKLIKDSANEVIFNSLLLLSLGLVIVIFVIRAMGEKVIISPLYSLMKVTERLSKGELDARSATTVGVKEFNVLSQQFNHMAESLQKTNKEISELSLIDGLTNISNRRGLDQRLDEEYRRSLRMRQPISILMVDIDYFKEFNDNYGHLSGDDCLRTLGLILKSASHRPADYPARYGGEEFIVILPETDYEGACAFANQIHSNIAERQIPHRTSHVAQYLTVSIGIVTLQNAESVKSPIEFLKLVDDQLYKAKHEGRNRTVGLEI